MLYFNVSVNVAGERWQDRIVNFDRVENVSENTEGAARCSRCDGWGEEREPAPVARLAPGLHGVLLTGAVCPDCDGSGTVQMESRLLVASASA